MARTKEAICDKVTGATKDANGTSAQHKPKETWLSNEGYAVTWDPRISTMGDRCLPLPVGTVKAKEKSKMKLVVHDPR